MLSLSALCMENLAWIHEVSNKIECTIQDLINNIAAFRHDAGTLLLAGLDPARSLESISTRLDARLTAVDHEIDSLKRRHASYAKRLRQQMQTARYRLDLAGSRNWQFAYCCRTKPAD